MTRMVVECIERARQARLTPTEGWPNYDVGDGARRERSVFWMLAALVAATDIHSATQEAIEKLLERDLPDQVAT